MEKNSIIRKAKRLFIGDENFCDDTLCVFYRIVRGAIPEITDSDCGDVLIDKLHETMWEILNVGEIKFLLDNYSSDEDDETDSSLSTAAASSNLKSILTRLALKKEMFYIPAIKTLKKRNYSYVKLEDFGLNARSYNQLKRARVTGEDLLIMTEAQIGKVRNIGKGGLKEILEKRQKYIDSNL